MGLGSSFFGGRARLRNGLTGSSGGRSVLNTRLSPKNFSPPRRCTDVEDTGKRPCTFVLARPHDCPCQPFTCGSYLAAVLCTRRFAIAASAVPSLDIAYIIDLAAWRCFQRETPSPSPPAGAFDMSARARGRGQSTENTEARHVATMR